MTIDEANVISLAAEDLGTNLEAALGHEVRSLRKQCGLTVMELAKMAGLSAGMLSKIENGLTSPSLATLQSLADSLEVPVSTLFRRHEQLKSATLVKRGEGVIQDWPVKDAVRECRLLSAEGGSPQGMLAYEITLEHGRSTEFHLGRTGMQFVRVVEGAVDYHHGRRVFRLNTGDSLSFDGSLEHGVQEVVDGPARLVLVTCSAEA